MVVRDDLYRLIDQLPDADQPDALAVLTALRERATGGAGAARDPEAETAYPAAVAEGVRAADRPGARWVSQAAMERWLASWGTDEERPPPPARPRR
jgi:hypothetical protein